MKPRRPPLARKPFTTKGMRSSVISRSRGECQKHCAWNCWKSSRANFSRSNGSCGLEDVGTSEVVENIAVPSSPRPRRSIDSDSWIIFKLSESVNIWGESRLNASPPTAGPQVSPSSLTTNFHGVTLIDHRAERSVFSYLQSTRSLPSARALPLQLISFLRPAGRISSAGGSLRTKTRREPRQACGPSPSMERTRIA
jgi:hypothetical protein